MGFASANTPIVLEIEINKTNDNIVEIFLIISSHSFSFLYFLTIKKLFLKSFFID
ncbi:hypothetical protein BN168_590066 [Clostridioides difficile CD002]|nr:hypothetical protein BN167_1630059 [Clostridioides difficile E13]CCL08149.1 hypothetical protein BN168_590066 [Clostridioides difficile CD002]